MSDKRASATVPMAPDELFSRLCEVESWPAFLEGLDEVERTGHRRYRWRVRFAKHTREVDVVVSVDPKVRRVSWKHQHGAAFDGSLRVVPHGDRRSDVELVLDVEPEGLVEGVVDAFGAKGTSGWRAERDVQRLRDLVASGELPGQVGAPDPV
ncbi:SRPBCC family protein [Thalassiella azotivora]